MKPFLILSFFFLTGTLFSAPYHGVIQSFKQPDGQKVELKLYGTEYYMRAEGLDGYTVIRDSKTNWICYANISQNEKELVSTGIKYVGESSTPFAFLSSQKIPLHLDISSGARKKIIEKNSIKLSGNKNPFPNYNQGTPIHLVSGQIKGLCILVDFSDEPASLAPSEYEGFCNDLNYSNYGNNGSLRSFYKDISGGLLDYQNVVYGFFRAPLTFAQYDAMPYATGTQLVLGLALNWIRDQGFDFSTLTLNPDNSIQAINLMYTGNPPNWAQGMWFHQGYYSSFTAGGIKSGAYNCSPASSPLGIGVVAHENGHMIGKWPDTYKYDSNSGPDGIGGMDLMCWYGSSNNPCPPNPLFRSNAGWGKVIDVTHFNGLVTDTANDGVCYKFRNINDTSEFFLMESRMKTGRSETIESEGLSIWQIDRNGDNQTFHHEVYLEHANNNISNIENACFRGGYKPEFSATTIPNSHFYNEDPSGLRVWNISPKNQVMTYKIGTGTTGPSLQIQYAGYSGDNNNNGFLEPGESAQLQVNSINFGQMPSANAKLVCKAVGINASYAQVSSDTLLLGIIEVNDTIPGQILATISPSTPLGTIVSFQFTLTDGSQSIYITRNITIGTILTVGQSLSDSTCQALFFDSGISTNYTNNEEVNYTIFPSTPGAKVKVQFLEFNLEDDIDCEYDYLEIYDGPTFDSPYLGTFCGTNSPGTITSTDSSGALSFFFRSDYGVTMDGWKALVSCESNTETVSMEKRNPLSIFPNPSAGIFTLHVGKAKTGDLTLFDAVGKSIFHQTATAIQKLTLDLTHQPTGVYLVKWQENNQTFTRKISVVR